MPGPHVFGVPSVPGIDHTFQWGEPDAESLLAFHCQRIENRPADSDLSPHPRILHDLTEVCDSVNRSHALRIAHHKRIGYVNGKALVDIFHGGLTPGEMEILYEIERQKFEYAIASRSKVVSPPIPIYASSRT